MTLLVLSLVALTVLGCGFALGYYCGHHDGYDEGWRARSYAQSPRWLELVVTSDDTPSPWVDRG